MFVSARRLDYAARNLLLVSFAKSGYTKEIIIIDEEPDEVEKKIETLGGKRIATITKLRSWTDLT